MFKGIHNPIFSQPGCQHRTCMHQKQCMAHSGLKKKGQQHQFGGTGFHVFFFCFETCAIIKHKGKLIPQAKQLPVKIDMLYHLVFHVETSPYHFDSCRGPYQQTCCDRIRNPKSMFVSWWSTGFLLRACIYRHLHKELHHITGKRFVHHMRHFWCRNEIWKTRRTYLLQHWHTRKSCKISVPHRLLRHLSSVGSVGLYHVMSQHLPV